MKVYVHTLKEIFTKHLFIDGLDIKTTNISIPFFQRSYVWKEEQLIQFKDEIDEMIENDSSLFMGTIIRKYINNSYMLIDGQQRITTLILFLKVLAIYKSNFIEKFKNIFCVRDDYDYKCKFQVAKIDSPLFKDLINEYEEFYNFPSTAKDSNLKKAYEFFIHPDKEQWFLKFDFDKIINKLEFVDIVIEKDEDEQKIFSTINSIGVKLTSAELLKNYLFNVEEESLYNSKWRKCFESDEETKIFWYDKKDNKPKTRSHIDKLLHSYLIIKASSIKNLPNEKWEKFIKVESMFSNFKVLIDEYIDRQELIEEINRYGILFRKNINDDDLLEDTFPKKSEINKLLFLINALDANTILPYLVFLLDAKENKQIDDFMFDAILAKIQGYVIRRIVCNLTTKNYSQFFTLLIKKQILDINNLEKILCENDSDYSRFPTDSELDSNIKNVKLTNLQGRTILYLVEINELNSFDATLPKAFNQFQLEHLCPIEWEKKWRHNAMPSNGYLNDQARDAKIKTIGNMAIITGKLNKSIKNSAWSEKLHGNNGKNLKKYASGIKTNDLFLNKADWNENEIDERSTIICKYIKRIWK